MNSHSYAKYPYFRTQFNTCWLKTLGNRTRKKPDTWHWSWQTWQTRHYASDTQVSDDTQVMKQMTLMARASRKGKKWPKGRTVYCSHCIVSPYAFTLPYCNIIFSYFTILYQHTLLLFHIVSGYFLTLPYCIIIFSYFTILFQHTLLLYHIVSSYSFTLIILLSTFLTWGGLRINFLDDDNDGE